MKRMSTFLAALFVLCLQTSLNAQTYTYSFNGTLAEDGAVGPTLTEDLSCGATNGAFGSHTINTTTATCGSTAQSTWDFQAGGGIVFDNSGSLIGPSYTINIFFQFNNLTSFRRVLDFHNGTDDNGVYTSFDCIRLFPPAGVTENIACPNFAPGAYHLITLVRGDGGADIVKMYIDGALDATYLDDGSQNGEVIYDAQAGPIKFFRDNDNVGSDCENSDGSIKYLALTSSVATAADVANTFVGICSTILPLNVLNFSGSKQGSAVGLSWTTTSEVNTSHFEVERGSVTNKFVKLADIPAANRAGANNYSYLDNQPLSGAGYYRLKMVDIDGGFKYTGILKINFNGNQKFEVYPNPVKDVFTLTGIKPGGKIKVLSAEGKELFQKQTSGESMTVDITKYSSGLYYLQYSDGKSIQNKKVVKN